MKILLASDILILIIINEFLAKFSLARIFEETYLSTLFLTTFATKYEYILDFF